MIEYITQAIQKIISGINLVKNLDDSRDPNEAGDIHETREELEYVAVTQSPKQEIPPEIICEILTHIEDPIEITNLMYINRTWNKEGKRILYKYREQYFDYLRINDIMKLDPFIRFLKIDRLDIYRKIQKNIFNQYIELRNQKVKASLEETDTYNNLIRYARIKYPGIYALHLNNSFEFFTELDERYKELHQIFKEKEKISEIIYKKYVEVNFQMDSFDYYLRVMNNVKIFPNDIGIY